MRRLPALLIAAMLVLAALAPHAASETKFGPPTVPAGFRIEPVIQDLHHPTRLQFGPDGRLYIAQQTGEIIAVTLAGGKETARQQVAKAKLHLLGIALKDDRLWTSDTGAISVYTRAADGTYTDRQEIVPNVPHGLHQNDGFAWGPDGKLYWGLGSTKDRGPESHDWSGTIMRMNPDGTDLAVYARGFRNPYGIAFDGQGRLWVTDNGADDPVSSDELNLVLQGAHYGYPDVFEMPPPGSLTKAPVVLFGDHNSTNGLTVYTGTQFPRRYQGQIFVAMWGSSFDDTTGRAVGLVELTPAGDGFTGKLSTFAPGFTRPLDLIMGPDGDLWVADFVPGIVYRIWYDGPMEASVTPTVPETSSGLPVRLLVVAALGIALLGGGALGVIYLSRK